MRTKTVLLPLLSLFSVYTSTNAQVAAGGGLVATTLGAAQVPATTTAGSLFTVNGVTSATWKLFTQTFAATALGSWELGPTPAAGSIGLGDIQGTVGGIKTKRGDPAPSALFGSA